MKELKKLLAPAVIYGGLGGAVSMFISMLLYR